MDDGSSSFVPSGNEEMEVEDGKAVPTSPYTMAGKRTRGTDRQLSDDVSDILLGDLIDCELVNTRDRLTFLGHNGLIVKDGWIEDLDLQEKFPELSTWIQRVAREEGQKALLKQSDLWHLIEFSRAPTYNSKGKKLADLRKTFLDNRKKKISQSYPSTRKSPKTPSPSQKKRRSPAPSPSKPKAKSVVVEPESTVDLLAGIDESTQEPDSEAPKPSPKKRKITASPKVTKPKASPSKKAKTATPPTKTTAAKDVMEVSDISEPIDEPKTSVDLLLAEEPPALERRSQTRTRASPKKASPKASAIPKSAANKQPTTPKTAVDASTQPPSLSAGDELTVPPSTSVEPAPGSDSTSSPPSSPSMEFEHDRAIRDHEIFLNELMKIAEEEAKQAVEAEKTKQAVVEPPVAVSTTTTDADATAVNNTKFAVILPTGLRSQMLSHIQLLVEKLGGRMVNSYSPQVTHIVTLVDPEGCTKRTIKYCQGVLSGCWVVSFDWVMASFQSSAWAPEDKFEVNGDVISGRKANTPHRARLTLNANQSPAKSERLFKGYRFYFGGSQYGTPSREELLSLVDAGHGFVCKTEPTPPKNTKELLAPSSIKTILICDSAFTKEEEAKDLYFRTGSLPVSVQWLLDSVSWYRALRPEDYYLISEAKVRMPNNNVDMSATQVSQEI